MLVVSHQVIEVGKSIALVIAQDVHHVVVVCSGIEHPNLELLDGFLVEESQVLAIHVVLVHRRFQRVFRGQLELHDRPKGPVDVFVELGLQQPFSDTIR